METTKPLGEIVEIKQAEINNNNTCEVCGFTAKSTAGLAVHKLKHKLEV
jgi:hypothetical protein